MEYLTKINKNGQISIPSALRKKLHLKTGEMMKVEEGRAGKILVTPVSITERSPFERLKKYEERGVDLSLLWESLKRTPTERLERHQEMLALVEEVERAGREKRAKAKRIP